MSEIVLVMSLLQKARQQGVSSHKLETKASRLLTLWSIVGESRAYRAAFESFIRELSFNASP